MHQRAMIGHGCRKIRAKMPSNNTSFQFGHLLKIIWAECLFLQTQHSQRIRPRESWNKADGARLGSVFSFFPLFSFSFFSFYMSY